MKDKNIPATNLYTSYFFQNLLMDKWTDKGQTRVLSLPMPDDAKMPGFNVDDIGLWVRAALEDPEKWIGKDMQACSDMLSPKRIAEILSEVSGHKWDTEHFTKEAFMALEHDMDHELWLNYLAFTNG